MAFNRGGGSRYSHHPEHRPASPTTSTHHSSPSYPTDASSSRSVHSIYPTDHGAPHPGTFFEPPGSLTSFSATSQPEASRIGQARCYWSLLSANLTFVYVEPVLANHLGSQAQSIIGTSILDYVHPDEKDQAYHDLSRVIKSKAINGSATRVRYCRLSAIKSRLGLRQAERSTAEPSLTDTKRLAYDETFLTCEIILNWVADHPNLPYHHGGGLALCFMHAAIDVDPNRDNDEYNKSNWSNWCETPAMRTKDIEDMYRQLMGNVTPSQFTGPSHSSHIFQILSNGSPRRVLFHWPPSDADRELLQYLVQNAPLDMKSGGPTGCQRRLRTSEQTRGALVESIFIPRGSVVFACYHIHERYRQSAKQYSPSSSEQGLGLLIPQLHTQAPGTFHPFGPSTWGRDAPLRDRDLGHGSGHPPWPPQPTSSSGGPDRGGATPPHRDRPLRRESGSAPQRSSVKTFSSHPSPAQSAISPTSLRSVGGLPPVGVPACTNCGVTASAEWRKGPSGKKDLCNACGLRYSRAKAKMLGQQPQRRLKDDGPVPGQSPVHLTHPSGPPYPVEPSQPRQYSSPYATGSVEGLPPYGVHHGPTPRNPASPEGSGPSRISDPQLLSSMDRAYMHEEMAHRDPYYGQTSSGYSGDAHRPYPRQTHINHQPGVQSFSRFSRIPSPSIDTAHAPRMSLPPLRSRRQGTPEDEDDYRGSTSRTPADSFERGHPRMPHPDSRPGDR